ARVHALLRDLDGHDLLLAVGLRGDHAPAGRGLDDALLELLLDLGHALLHVLGLLQDVAHADHVETAAAAAFGHRYAPFSSRGGRSTKSTSSPLVCSITFFTSGSSATSRRVRRFLGAAPAAGVAPGAAAEPVAEPVPETTPLSGPLAA